MELKQFAAESLVQIVRGIEDATKQLADSAAIVSPGSFQSVHSDFKATSVGFHAPGKYDRRVEQVEFDVAVYASEGKETKGGIGIVVGSIGIGTQGKSDAASSSQSRLKFAVPVVLPQGDKQE